MGLISLLLDITLSRDVPFCQPQQAHRKHHGAYLCPILFQFFLLTMQGSYEFAIMQSGFPLAFLKRHGFIAEKFPTLLFIYCI